jgi:hypothetical protein
VKTSLCDQELASHYKEITKGRKLGGEKLGGIIKRGPKCL